MGLRDGIAEGLSSVPSQSSQASLSSSTLVSPKRLAKLAEHANLASVSVFLHSEETRGDGEERKGQIENRERGKKRRPGSEESQNARGKDRTENETNKKEENRRRSMS